MARDNNLLQQHWEKGLLGLCAVVLLYAGWSAWNRANIADPTVAVIKLDQEFDRRAKETFEGTPPEMDFKERLVAQLSAADDLNLPPHWSFYNYLGYRTRKVSAPIPPRFVVPTLELTLTDDAAGAGTGDIQVNWARNEDALPAGRNINWATRVQVKIHRYRAAGSPEDASVVWETSATEGQHLDEIFTKRTDPETSEETWTRNLENGTSYAYFATVEYNGSTEQLYDQDPDDGTPPATRTVSATVEGRTPLKYAVQGFNDKALRIQVFLTDGPYTFETRPQLRYSSKRLLGPLVEVPNPRRTEPNPFLKVQEEFTPFRALRGSARGSLEYLDLQERLLGGIFPLRTLAE